MVTQFNQSSIKAFKVKFSPEPVSSFGGLVLAERLAARLGLWNNLAAAMPRRHGCIYDWTSTIKAMVAGLLTGARGTFCAEPIRADEPLMKLLGIKRAPEEAQLWRMLGPLGEGPAADELQATTYAWAKRVLAATPRHALMRSGRVPVFVDATLLEGSSRREGTKCLRDKGSGLLWTTVFVGPVLVAERLCRPGEGEATVARELIAEVYRRVLKPLKLHKHALVLADSLHGSEPTLALIESLGLDYVIGANARAATETTLDEQPEVAWRDSGPRAKYDWVESATCSCWLQCEGWSQKRNLIGRRYKRNGEMFFNYRGVVTNLSEKKVNRLNLKTRNFMSIVWRLYDGKGAAETYYAEPLEDLGLHHPPCESLARNQGFYRVATLALMLARAVDLIGGANEERGSRKRKDGGKRRRAKPRTMRLWKLRRVLFTLPARVASHARTAHVNLLTSCETTRVLFEQYWSAIIRC